MEAEIRAKLEADRKRRTDETKKRLAAEKKKKDEEEARVQKAMDEKK